MPQQKETKLIERNHNERLDVHHFQYYHSQSWSSFFYSLLVEAMFLVTSLQINSLSKKSLQINTCTRVRIFLVLQMLLITSRRSRYFLNAMKVNYGWACVYGFGLMILLGLVYRHGLGLVQMLCLIGCRLQLHVSSVTSHFSSQKNTR